MYSSYWTSRSIGTILTLCTFPVKPVPDITKLLYLHVHTQFCVETVLKIEKLCYKHVCTFPVKPIPDIQKLLYKHVHTQFCVETVLEIEKLRYKQVYQNFVYNSDASVFELSTPLISSSFLKSPAT